MDPFIIFAIIVTIVMLFLILSPVDLLPGPFDDMGYVSIIVIVWSLVIVDKTVDIYNKLFYSTGSNLQILTGTLLVMLAGLVIFAFMRGAKNG